MSQPKPIHNTTEPTFEVLKRLVDRKAEAGRLKYGIALQPLNGRCSLVDLLEELVDGSKYALNEIRNQREILQKLVRWSNDLAVVDDPGAKLVQQGIEELFVALGGWRSISMYDDLLGDFAGVGKMVNVPRRFGMTDQVPPAAASSERQTGVIKAYLRQQAEYLRQCDTSAEADLVVDWLLAEADRLDLEHASPTVANDATVRDQILDDVLALLAGAGIPTPERGYKADGGWGLALSDLKKLVVDRVSILEQAKRLGQANGDLRKERDRAVAEAQRQDGVAKGLRKKLEAARKENDFMRLRLAESDRACVYCNLPANETGKCASGFPGCARADDLYHCDELSRRDERMKLIGAAEWLEQFAGDADGNIQITHARLRELAAQLRREAEGK